MLSNGPRKVSVDSEDGKRRVFTVRPEHVRYLELVIANAEVAMLYMEAADQRDRALTLLAKSLLYEIEVIRSGVVELAAAVRDGHARPEELLRLLEGDDGEEGKDGKDGPAADDAARPRGENWNAKTAPQEDGGEPANG